MGRVHCRKTKETSFHLTRIITNINITLTRRTPPKDSKVQTQTKVVGKVVKLNSQHENGDLRRIKVCVNLRKVSHPTLRKLSTARKGL